MTAILVALLATAADAPTEPPPYALNRNQLETLLRSLGRPVGVVEVGDIYERVRFFRPLQAVSLLRNPAFIAETDELFKEVYGRPATVSELFAAARGPRVVASRRYVKRDLERLKATLETSYCCVIKDTAGKPVQHALLIESMYGVVRRTDAMGRALFERPDTLYPSTVHQVMDDGYHALFDEISFRRTRPHEFVLRRLDGGSISGTVRDAAGNPVPDALVVLDYSLGGGPNFLRVTTDAVGRYAVKWIHPEANLIQLSADRPGSLRAFVRLETPKKRKPPVVLENIDLVLRPSGKIVGRVLDPAGKPVALAQVRLGRARPHDDAVFTDVQERFIIDQNVRPGAQLVVAERRGFVLAAEKVSVEPGASKEVTLTLTEGAYIRGKVVDAADKPKANAVVYQPLTRSLFGFGRDDDLPLSSTADAADEQGRFELGPFPPGKTFGFTVRGTRSEEDFTGVSGAPEVLCRLAK